MVIQQDGPNSSSATARGHDSEHNPRTAERDGLHVPKTDASGYSIREEPFGTKRKVRVVLMGAGASTVNFLKKAEEQMQNVELAVYEKNHDIGGTWLENRYPGCACDVCYCPFAEPILSLISSRSPASTTNSHGRSRPGHTSIHTHQRSTNTSRTYTRRMTSSINTSNSATRSSTPNGTTKRESGNSKSAI